MYQEAIRRNKKTKKYSACDCCEEKETTLQDNTINYNHSSNSNSGGCLWCDCDNSDFDAGDFDLDWITAVNLYIQCKDARMSKIDQK